MTSLEYKELPSHGLEQKGEYYNPRAIEVYMVRHGKQNEYGDYHSALSPEGEQQAREFAHTLARNIANKSSVIKIKFSKELRATETARLIKEEIDKLITDGLLPHSKLLADHPTKQLKTTGALIPIMDAGVPYEEAMEEWLNNTEKYPTARTPEEIKREVDYLVHITSRTAERVPAEGPGIIYVWVTHETATWAVMQALANKTPAEMGGSIGHLEPVKISFDKTNPYEPHVFFRGQELIYEHSKKETGKA
ncbi:MAG TPA: histidine phosphatase family protein [Patescibacteria group bacterium]|nr:histidine phosphatase family protein [Patescibacteria group bacterium]